MSWWYEVRRITYTKEVLKWALLEDLEIEVEMAVKVYNDVTDAFICNTGLEHRHDHIINALETFSFKMRSNGVKIEVNSLFC